MSNTFGTVFRITVLGESHGKMTGIVVDGCPAGIKLSENDFLADIKRRQTGKKGTSSRREQDVPFILSGVFNNYTTGAPVTVIFENKDVKTADYENIKDLPRPGHADFVAQKKYNGFNDYRGGGRFSGRLTLPLVAAGVIAKKIIAKIKIHAFVEQAGGSCDIEKAVDIAKKKNDTIGGIIKCEVSNLPVGLGEPFFDSVESLISHLAFSVPAVKGIEFGAGFGVALMYGSEHNDLICDTLGNTKTNNAGGINGGITNGNDIIFRVAVKPASSIAKEQNTINMKTGKIEKLIIDGRHDTCIALRVPVIIEAITAIALVDLIKQANF